MIRPARTAASSSPKPTLLVDWCSVAAARHAVMTWHYSKTMPTFGSVRLGVWEDGQFVGAVIFNNGVARYRDRALAIDRKELCELVRVALAPHKTPTSRIVTIALRKLHALLPNLRLVVSFADSAQGHIGSIYQAMGWTYTGISTAPGFAAGGRKMHWRTMTQRSDKLAKTMALNPGARKFVKDPKFRYYYALDKTLQPALDALAQPYPKKTSGRLTSEALGVHPGEAVQGRPVRSKLRDGGRST